MRKLTVLMLVALLGIWFVTCADEGLPSEGVPEAVMEGVQTESERPEVHVLDDEEEPADATEDPDPLEETEIDEEAPMVGEPGVFTLDVSGRKTWTIRMGIGNAHVLAGQGLTPGLPVLHQTLAAEITGTALDILTLEASFNDQLGPGFQKLIVRLDRPPWHGELGDFALGVQELGVYNKKLLGARLVYEGDGYSVTGVAAREQGISESRTFRGQIARADIQFTTLDPDRPGEPALYRRSVEGLYYFRLRYPFVEGFSMPELAFDASAQFRSFLMAYELGYLADGFEAMPERPLESGEVMVIQDDGDVLLLRNSPDTLLRTRIRNAITAYNREQGLTGEDRRRYPFVEGSDLEQGFLERLRGYVVLRVDNEEYLFDEAQRRRYLPLDERDIVDETLELWVRPAGEAELRPITDPAFVDYAWRLYRREGILRIDFPADFFGEDAAVRARFDHKREGDTFTLGLSVVPGSERVYRNNQLLTRDVDYMIDYEIGLLILFDSLGEEDVLRVDFERQRGGLGGFAEYERGFYGIVLSIPELDGFQLTLVHAADSGRPSPAARTMPNEHSVLAARLAGDALGWQYSLSLGGSQNIFPLWDNERLAAPNRINVVAEATALGARYVLFGHQNGLTVHDGTSYATYGPAAGLGGQQVRDVAVVFDEVYIATEAGLTIVSLQDTTPFDRVRNWARVPADRTFPGDETFALAYGNGRVFLATDESIAVFHPEDVQDMESWDIWPLPEDAVPTALHWFEGVLHLGTLDGLYIREGELWNRMGEVGGAVHALASGGGLLHVGTDQGVRTLQDGAGAGWTALGEKVSAVAVHEGRLWYGTTRGLFRDDDAVFPAVSGVITAVSAAHGEVWAGTMAQDDYTLDLWRIAAQAERISQEETRIDGRDLGQFRDIPRGDHTARGLSGTLTLNRQDGPWTWSLDLATRWPGYQEIGRSDRTDAHGFGLSLSYAGEGDWRASTRLRWELTELWDTPHHALAGGLDLQWKPGATYTFSLSPSLRGPAGTLFDTFESGYRLSASWPGDTLSGRLSLSGRLIAPEWYTTGRVDGALLVKPFTGWSLDLQGFRPYRTEGSPGNQGVNATLNWTQSADVVSWTAAWSESWRNRIGTATWSSERSAKLDLRWVPVNVGTMRLTPTMTVDWSHSARETRWRGSVNARLQERYTDWQFGLRFGQGYRPATERGDRSASLSIRWEDRGTWYGFRPSVRWQGSLETLTHPAHGDRTTTQHELQGRLVWEPDSGLRNEITLTYRSRDASWVLANRISWPSPIGQVSADTTLTWKDDKLVGSTTASMGWSFGEMWSLGATVMHGFDLVPGSDFRQAVNLGVTLGASF